MLEKSKRSAKPPRPFKSAAQEVFLIIQKTADGLMTELAELLKPHGISATQYNVLRILRGAGAGCDGGHADPDTKGLSCREIAQRMITRDPDMTRLLDRLEERKLLIRQRDKADRRMITTRITSAGLDLIQSLDQPVLDLHDQQLGHLSETKLLALLKLLERVRDHRAAENNRWNNQQQLFV